MMTLKDIQERNAKFRARKEAEEKAEEKAEQPKNEVKGRRPKNRRNLVVGDVVVGDGEPEAEEENAETVVE